MNDDEKTRRLKTICFLRHWSELDNFDFKEIPPHHPQADDLHFVVDGITWGNYLNKLKGVQNA